jgi:ROK family
MLVVMDARRTTVRDMRRANRSVILSRIFRDGPLSRQEIGGHTALSAASVSNLVGELLAEGVVEEAGSVESDGGRPRVLLRVAPGFGYVVGAEVGETRIRVELFDLAMNQLAKSEHAIEPTSVEPAAVVRRVRLGLDEAIERAGADPDKVLGLGVAVAGIVDVDEHAVVHAQTLGWDGVPLAAMLRERTDVPVQVDNGANMLGQAEMWYGAGRGAQHAVVALVGSGVGSALVAGGTGYRGSGTVRGSGATPRSSTAAASAEAGRVAAWRRMSVPRRSWSGTGWRTAAGPPRVRTRRPARRAPRRRCSTRRSATSAPGSRTW